MKTLSIPTPKLKWKRIRLSFLKNTTFALFLVLLICSSIVFYFDYQFIAILLAFVGTLALYIKHIIDGIGSLDFND